MPAIGSTPAGHRALLDPKRESALFGVSQERNELGFEHCDVLIHLQIEVCVPTKPHTASVFEQHRGIEYPPHEVVLVLSGSVVGHQHVVEVGEIRQPDPVSPSLRQARDLPAHD